MVGATLQTWRGRVLRCWGDRQLPQPLDHLSRQRGCGVPVSPERFVSIVSRSNKSRWRVGLGRCGRHRRCVAKDRGGGPAGGSEHSADSKSAELLLFCAVCTYVHSISGPILGAELLLHKGTCRMVGRTRRSL